MISARFCPICGAANDLARTHCFACGDSLASETQEETLLCARYRLGATLGTGGFSAVYHAHDLQTGKEVAIKRVTLLGLSAEETIEATDTFNREQNLLSTLQHPQVPQLYDHFHDRDHWYLVLEYLEGTTLESYLEKRVAQGKPLRIDEILSIGLQLCTVLEYLHTRQPAVIFRDLKPGNIIRSTQGKLSLIDFGIARRFRKGQIRDTRPLGSPGYASPEQYGRAQTTPQSDLYSLGVLLYALLSGKDPSEETGYAGLVPLPLDGGPGGHQLAELVRHLLAPFPDKRPASASEVATELEAIRRQLQIHDVSRIWHPPEVPQSPISEEDHQRQVQVVQAQFQAQFRAQKSAARRRFLRRGLMGGVALIGGGTVLGYLMMSVSQNGQPGVDLQPQPAFRPPHGRMPISLISWAPDGVHAVLVSLNSSIFIYRRGQGADPGFFLSLAGENVTPISSLNWSPDSKYIAFGSTYGFVTTWDVQHASPVLTYAGAPGLLEAIAWSPDGTLTASLNAQNDVRVCRTSDGSVVAWLSGSGVYGSHILAWSPDSKRLVVKNSGFSEAGGVPSLQVWDIEAGTRFAFGTLPMLAAAWSPDGKLIATVDSNATIYLWQSTDGAPVASFTMNYDLRVFQSDVALSWSPDSAFVALDTGSNTLHLLNVQTHMSDHEVIYLKGRRSMVWALERQIVLLDESQHVQFIEV